MMAGRFLRSFYRFKHAAASEHHSENLARSLYGGRYQVAAIPGDGVGPELMDHVKTVFKTAKAPVDFETLELHAKTTDPNELHNAIMGVKRNGVAIKGNMETLDVEGFKSLNVELRVQLDLFANVLHCKSIPNYKTRHDNVDVVCIRENTEGEYSSLEHESVPGVVESLKVITAAKSTRIAKYAFDYAVRHGRKKVTAVHKANIMKAADGLFLACCREVAKTYPNIEFDEKIVDNMCMQVVSHPEQFDVVVMTNLYGNIIMNILVGMVGGAGLVAGSNIGHTAAVFEAGTRNTGKTLRGKNVANPCALLLAGADMLDYLQCPEHGRLIRDAVYRTVIHDQLHTPDMNGDARTTDVIDRICQHILENIK